MTYLITTKNIFSTKILTTALLKIYPEHYIVLLGPTFIGLNSKGIHSVIHETLRNHTTKVVHKEKKRNTTQYTEIKL